MMPVTQQHDEPPEMSDPNWFREPTRREHWIAAGLFVAFGLFFALLFVVQRGWWFGWVVLALGVISILHGTRHAMDAMRNAKSQPDSVEIPAATGKGRWVSLIAYAMIFLLVAGLFVFLFIQFTSSWRLALILVAFLVGYMLLMGYLAGRNVEGRDER